MRWLARLGRYLASRKELEEDRGEKGPLPPAPKVVSLRPKSKPKPKGRKHHGSD